MSQKQPLDFKSQCKRRTESEGTANDLAQQPSEYKNTRLHSKRAISPTPSYLSMRTDWSMDPPTNFKDGETSPLHSSSHCLPLLDIIMSQKQPHDFKSQCKRRTESEGTANDLAQQPSEYKNTRLHSKRAISPTPSYLSMRTDWSMDPPTNFKDGETSPLHSRLHSKRAISPTPSYLSMRTDWSMDPPTNFEDGETSPLHSRIKRKRETSPVNSYISLKSAVNPVNDSRGNTSMQRERAASPTPTCLSLRTDWSMDPPTNFRAAETFPLDPRLLTEHHLRCPLCKSMLKDPVSIPCGHNYCRGCINEFWDNCAGNYVCPQCGNPSETRPVLNTNAALVEVVRNLQQAGFSPALPPQSYAEPEDIACDFCTERRLKAVKCCSTCGVSLCETHVRPHYTIPALQKHTLSDVTGDIKTRPSQQHQNTDDSFSDTVSGQQHQTDKTQDIIKEVAVSSFFETVLNTGKVQTRPKRPAKTFRPKTKDNKDVRSLARMCSTLQQEVLGLKKNLSRLKPKKRKQKETYHDDKKDYGEEDDDEEEEDSVEEDDDEEEEDSVEEDDDEEDDEYEKEYAEEEEDYGEEDDYGEEEDYGEEDDEEEDDSANSEIDGYDGYEDGYDGYEEGNTDDYDGEEDDEDYY